jgi:hypothetical protein
MIRPFRSPIVYGLLVLLCLIGAVPTPLLAQDATGNQAEKQAQLEKLKKGHQSPSADDSGSTITTG